MEGADCPALARALFCCYVTRTGYTPPSTFADLLLFVQLSGIPVYYWETAPVEFTAVQIGDCIHINGRPEISDRERMRMLAHEWCHALRRRAFHKYEWYDGTTPPREREERIARAFERLF
jgi:hypothetical protein